MLQCDDRVATCALTLSAVVAGYTQGQHPCAQRSETHILTWAGERFLQPKERLAKCWFGLKFLWWKADFNLQQGEGRGSFVRRAGPYLTLHPSSRGRTFHIIGAQKMLRNESMNQWHING